MWYMQIMEYKAGVRSKWSELKCVYLNLFKNIIMSKKKEKEMSHNASMLIKHIRVPEYNMNILLIYYGTMHDW